MASTKFIADYKARAEKVEAVISAHSLGSSIMAQASNYSLRAGGKRLRPVLLIEMAQQGRTPLEFDPLPAALAVECIHTFSLIHDDLPCIDNADLRRGKPSCHKAFGEWQAVLAGDLLLNEAYRLIGRSYDNQLAGYLTFLTSDTVQRLLEGERADIEAEQLTADKVDLDFIYRGKTAAMISLPVKIGLSLARYTPEQIEPYAEAAEQVGIAFQIIDDLLDETGDPAKLGKNIAQDERKKTYLKKMGRAWCEAESKRLSEAARKTFSTLPQPEFILQTIDWLLEREV